MPSVFQNLETKVSTAAKQDTGNTSLASIDTKTPALQGGLVPVFLPPATVTALTPPAAISGFATSAKQDSGNTSLSSIDTKTPALVSGNVPVALSAGNLSTLTPPAAITGFATSAKQDTELASLASIDGKLPAQSAGTVPVSLPSATVTALTPASRASLVSTVNSTSANLAGAAVFTGASEDVKDYAIIQVTVFSSHVSATDGLSLQQSIDGTNWDISDVYTIPAATGKTFSLQVSARYYRLVYTNGATLTTSLRISSVYHYVSSRSASQRPTDARSNDNDFDETAAYLMGYDGTSAWNRLRSTVANGLAVDVTRNAALVAGAAAIGTVGITGLSAVAVPSDAMAQQTALAANEYQMQFNGSTWDRVRNNLNGTTGDTGAKTTTFSGNTATNYNARGAIITCLFGAVTGTTPTIALQMQWTPDGSTWINYGAPIAAFTPASGNTATFIVYPAQLSEDTSTTLAAFTTGATQWKAFNAPLPRLWRMSYTIAGTTPSITITGTYINYLQ